MITNDDAFIVYRDGVRVTQREDWRVAHTVALRSDVCVLGVTAVDWGDRHEAGFLASTSTGVVTDDSWKCSSQQQAQWHRPGFDDAAWSQALVRGTHGDARWESYHPQISAQAKWIWAHGTNATHVFCRKTLC